MPRYDVSQTAAENYEKKIFSSICLCDINIFMQSLEKVIKDIFCFGGASSSATNWSIVIDSLLFGLNQKSSHCLLD